MLRARHFACLILLLSTLGATGASAAPVRLTQTRIEAILARGAEAHAGSPAPQVSEPQNPGDPTATALPSAPHDIFRITPAAHPPTAQAASVHATTSLRRA